MIANSANFRSRATLWNTNPENVKLGSTSSVTEPVQYGDQKALKKSTRSKVKFLRSLRGEHVQDEPIVFTTQGKSPLGVFSSIAYNRHSQLGTREGLKDHVKQRQTSGSRQLSTILDGPEPLHLFEVMGLDRPVDARDLSFQHLLGISQDGNRTSRKKTISTTNFNFDLDQPNNLLHIYQNTGMCK